MCMLCYGFALHHYISLYSPLYILRNSSKVLTCLLIELLIQNCLSFFLAWVFSKISVLLPRLCLVLQVHKSYLLIRAPDSIKQLHRHNIIKLHRPGSQYNLLNGQIIKAIEKSQEKYCPKHKRDERITNQTNTIMKYRKTPRLNPNN